MKILVHFHFSFLLKIENNFTTHFSKFIFHNFLKIKMKIFWFLFSNFWKKWKWKFNEFIFQFSKQNKMAILFLSSLFNSGKKKWKLKFFRKFNFYCFFNVVAWSTTWRWKCADHVMLASVANRRKKWICNFLQNWIMNLQTKSPYFYLFFGELKNEFVKFSFFSKIWKMKSKNLHFHFYKKMKNEFWNMGCKIGFNFQHKWKMKMN